MNVISLQSYLESLHQEYTAIGAAAEPGVMIEVLLRVVPLIGADAVIAAIIEKE